MQIRNAFQTGAAVVTAWATLCCVGTMDAGAAAIELTNGKTVQGSSIRLSRGQYVIETPSGARTYDASQVKRAISDKPENWDAVVAAARSRPGEAVADLEAIAATYRGLDWDAKANLLIARIAAGRRDYQRAVEAYEDLPALYLKQAETRFGYWGALVELGRFDKVEGQLDGAIREGNREVSARAQLLRGDIKMKRRLLEPAALDYLRTVILYEKVKSVQPEALYKAGKALEELRHEGAAKMFETLRESYPNSEYASQM